MAPSLPFPYFTEVETVGLVVSLHSSSIATQLPHSTALFWIDRKHTQALEGSTSNFEGRQLLGKNLAEEPCLILKHTIVATRNATVVGIVENNLMVFKVLTGLVDK